MEETNLSQSFNSLAAMRAIQGIASAPLECLVVQTVSDLSFVHERGVRLAVWGTMIPVGVGAAYVFPMRIWGFSLILLQANHFWIHHQKSWCQCDLWNLCAVVCIAVADHIPLCF
jgi:MFS family permease